MLTGARKKTAAILVLFLCLLGTVAVCHLLEGLRPRPEEPVDELVDWDMPMAKADRTTATTRRSTPSRRRTRASSEVTGRRRR